MKEFQGELNSFISGERLWLKLSNLRTKDEKLIPTFVLKVFGRTLKVTCVIGFLMSCFMKYIFGLNLLLYIGVWFYWFLKAFENTVVTQLSIENSPYLAPTTLQFSTSFQRKLDLWGFLYYLDEINNFKNILLSSTQVSLINNCFLKCHPFHDSFKVSRFCTRNKGFLAEISVHY